MPYLPLDLDAKKLIPKVARVVGVSPGDVLWGLTELWEFVWNSKRDVVAEIVLVGCFDGSGKIIDALIAFEFLEKVEGGYRVRGAQRFLNVTGTYSESGSRGGKKTAASGKSLRNLRQFSEATREASDGLRRIASDPERPTEAITEGLPKPPPKPTPKPTEALHPAPSTQHPILLSADVEDHRPSKMLDVWNAAASGRIPKARPTDDRRPKLKRWLEKHNLEAWRGVVARINASSFLRGERGDFRATLDWALKPANLAKILDGNYDDHGPPSTAPPVEPCSQPACEFAAKLDLEIDGRQERVCETHFYRIVAQRPEPRAAS